MGAMQDLYVLTESQGQPAEAILAFQADEMLDRIVVRMIGVGTCLLLFAGLVLFRQQGDSATAQQTPPAGGGVRARE